MSKIIYTKIEDKKELKRIRNNFCKWKKAIKNRQLLNGVLKEQEDKCAMCSRKIKFWTKSDAFTIDDFIKGKHFDLNDYVSVDHIIPLSWGGGNTRENIQLLCSSCNSKKGNKYEN